MPDGVARALRGYLDDKLDIKSSTTNNDFSANGDGEQLAFQFGALCPECGEAAVVNEEGCRKCYACSYSEC